MYFGVGNQDAIPVLISDALYEELIDCEVEPYLEAEDLPGSHHQFCKAMTEATQVSSDWEVELPEDGLVYLLNIALPTNMEMWYSWGDLEGDNLMRDAKGILDRFNVYYPY